MLPLTSSGHIRAAHLGRWVRSHRCIGQVDWQVQSDAALRQNGFLEPWAGTGSNRRPPACRSCVVARVSTRRGCSYCFQTVRRTVLATRPQKWRGRVDDGDVTARLPRALTCPLSSTTSTTARQRAPTDGNIEHVEVKSPDRKDHMSLQGTVSVRLDFNSSTSTAATGDRGRRHIRELAARVDRPHSKPSSVPASAPSLRAWLSEERARDRAVRARRFQRGREPSCDVTSLLFRPQLTTNSPHAARTRPSKGGTWLVCAMGGSCQCANQAIFMASVLDLSSGNG
jgi:hypothetical protein